MENFFGVWLGKSSFEELVSEASKTENTRNVKTLFFCEKLVGGLIIVK